MNSASGRISHAFGDFETAKADSVSIGELFFRLKIVGNG